MDAFDLLIEQHREAEGLFARQRETKGKERLAVLVKLAEALTLHATLEERFLYPLAHPHGLGKEADAAEDVHDAIRRLVADMLDTKVNDPALDGRVAKLEATVKAHVTDEEARLIPALRAEGAVLASHRAELEEATRELQRQPLLLAADNEGELAPA